MKFAPYCFKPICALVLQALSFGALAQESAEPAAGPQTAASVPVSVTVTLASQYVSRGIRQTWGRPALQVGVDYVDPSGWSVGSWASNVSDRFIENASVEWDLYGGYSGVAGPVGYSVMAYYYKYPGAVISSTGTKFNYGELSVGVTYKAFYAKYNYTVTRDFFGIRDARGTGYLDVGMNHDLGAGYTLNLHAGDGRVAGAGNDYWDWRDVKLGVTKVLEGGWAIAGAYTRANGATDAYDAYTTGVPDGAGIMHFSNPAKGTFVLSVVKSF